MDQVAVATVRAQHRQEARETTAIHEAVAARVAVDAQVDVAAEAARVRATQAEEKEARDGRTGRTP
jgi:hypothetical protein